jgi:hypothetical protein
LGLLFVSRTVLLYFYLNHPALVSMAHIASGPPSTNRPLSVLQLRDNV